jgi:hypothetical protein
MLHEQEVAVGDEVFLPGGGYLTVLAVEGEQVLLAVSAPGDPASTTSDQASDPAEMQS